MKREKEMLKTHTHTLQILTKGSYIKNYTIIKWEFRHERFTNKQKNSKSSQLVRFNCVEMEMEAFRDQHWLDARDGQCWLFG